MEETSTTSPSRVLAFMTNLHSVPALSELVDGLELSDANSFSEINSTMLPFDEFSTPKKRQCFSLDFASAVPQTTQEEQESFVGRTMPAQVDILTPSTVNARGTCSRIKGHRDNEKKAGSNKKKLGVTLWVPRTCRTCKGVVLHDSRICPAKK